VAGYIENYHPLPSKISWRDAQLYEAVLTARAEHLKEIQKDHAG